MTSGYVFTNGLVNRQENEAEEMWMNRRTLKAPQTSVVSTEWEIPEAKLKT